MPSGRQNRHDLGRHSSAPVNILTAEAEAEILTPTRPSPWGGRTYGSIELRRRRCDAEPQPLRAPRPLYIQPGRHGGTPSL